MISRFEKNIKLKNNRGSALNLVIVSIALLSIIITSITFQINNVLMTNKKSYDYIKSKYKAEAGIEKSIFDIENDIKNQIENINNKSKGIYYSNLSHYEGDGCPKVSFDLNGNLEIHGINGFTNLIFMDIMQNKINIHSYFLTALNINIEKVLDKEKADLLTNYYVDTIRKEIETIQNGSIKYDSIRFENYINEFIELMESTIDDIKDSGKENSDKDKEVAIQGLNNIKEYMLEIKCRLGMRTNNGEGTQEAIFITIPYYDVTLDQRNQLNFLSRADKPNYRVEINVTLSENNEIENIDFSNLNKELLEGKSEDYIIQADIDFIFEKEDNGYSIKQKVNSYERKNK